MHASQTQLESPPFTHQINNVEFEDLDMDKLRTVDVWVPGNNLGINNKFKSFSEECYKIFKERYPRCLKGSVDVNPHTWTSVVINHLYHIIFIRGIDPPILRGTLLRGQFKDPDMFVFPNGCCTQGHCSINLFYEIVIEELLKNKRIINTDESVKKLYGDLSLNQTDDMSTMEENNHSCEQCGKLCKLMCSTCKIAHFCDRECLRLAWPKHKKDCKTVEVSQSNEEHI